MKTLKQMLFMPILILNLFDILFLSIVYLAWHFVMPEQLSWVALPVMLVTLVMSTIAGLYSGSEQRKLGY